MFYYCCFSVFLLNKYCDNFLSLSQTRNIKTHKNDDKFSPSYKSLNALETFTLVTEYVIIRANLSSYTCNKNSFKMSIIWMITERWRFELRSRSHHISYTWRRNRCRTILLAIHSKLYSLRLKHFCSSSVFYRCAWLPHRLLHFIHDLNLIVCC